MSVKLCPINCLAIACDSNNNLHRVPIGYDCSGDACEWWDEAEECCSIHTMSHALSDIAVFFDCVRRAWDEADEEATDQ
jgi:hypothetical protein